MVQNSVGQNITLSSVRRTPYGSDMMIASLSTASKNHSGAMRTLKMVCVTEDMVSMTGPVMSPAMGRGGSSLERAAAGGRVRAPRARRGWGSRRDSPGGDTPLAPRHAAQNEPMKRSRGGVRSRAHVSVGVTARAAMRRSWPARLFAVVAVGCMHGMLPAARTRAEEGTELSEAKRALSRGLHHSAYDKLRKVYRASPSAAWEHAELQEALCIAAAKLRKQTVAISACANASALRPSTGRSIVFVMALGEVRPNLNLSLNLDRDLHPCI